MIVKNSIEEEEFVNELKNRVGHIDTINIPDCKVLKRIIQEFIFIIEELMLKYLYVSITKHSEEW